MRWTVILLVCVAALLEILSWSKDTQSTLSIAIGGAVHLLALSCLFGAVLVVVLRVSTTRRLKLIICCAGVLVLSANFLNTTGKPAAWADFPLIGGHSAFQGWGERWFIVAGYVLFMGGLSLALGEVHTSNKALETKSAESAREAAERVRALKELDDKTKRLSAAEETARIGSWEWDERAQIMRCSEGLAALFGLQAGERELSYEELLSHVHPEERENVDRTILQAWETRGTLDHYHRYIDSRGEVRVLHGRGTVVVDENGVPVRMVGTAQDVTELKRVEEVLRQSEANFRVLAETTAAATFIHRGACFLYVNKAMIDLSGFSQADLLAMNYWELLAPEMREAVRERGQERLGGEDPPSRYEIAVITKAGERRWCDLTVARVNFEGQAAVLGAFFDVTDRKRAETVLAQERDLLRLLIDNMPDYIYIKDADSRFIVNNTAHLRQLGARTQDEVAGKTDFDVFPKDLAARYYADEQRIVQSGQPLLNREEATVDPQGREQFLLTTKVPTRDASGNVVGVVGISRDITEIKRAEGILAQERDLLRLLIDNMPDYIYIKDANSRFIVNNAAHLRVLGATKQDELAGKTDFDVFPNDLAARYYADEQQIVQSGQPLLNREETTVDPQGREQFLLTTKMPTRDATGNVVGVVGISRDITDRKRAEEALRDRERFLADIFASIQDGISVLDTELRIVRVNPAMEQWYAHAMPLVGKKCFEAYHGRGEPCEACPTLRAMKTARGAFEVVPKQGPTGATVGWFDLYSFPLVDQDTGKLKGVIEYVRDITAQRSLENQLRHAQKLESLGVLAGGIAHDFNNLLVGMLGYAGLALTKLPAESVARGYVEKIEASARKAADLTNQMLAYSGKGAFVVRPLDLSRLVEEVGRLLAASISKKAILRYDCARDLPPVVGDAAQLHQVVMNLITNASDAIGDQPGVITLRTDAVRLGREYLATTYINDELPEGLYVILEVSDTGCGMDRETLGRIFDPFFSTKFAGRGLGLAAVLGIVRGHKGAIKVYSEAEQGTTFKILLPAKEAQQGAVDPEGRPKDTTLDAWRGHGLVLIADDEETARSVAEEVLKQYGFSVVMAENGREAVERFRIHAQELVAVLLDLTMPLLGGQEAFEEIQHIRAEVPVVMSSGYTEQDVSTRFTGARPAAFLQKPYIHTDLVNKLRNVIKADHLA
jgi:PAS domain S-box-containing protein